MARAKQFSEFDPVAMDALIGTTPKTVLAESGALPLEIPRDRDETASRAS